jgi:hypothetical protein
VSWLNPPIILKVQHCFNSKKISANKIPRAKICQIFEIKCLNVSVGLGFFENNLTFKKIEADRISEIVFMLFLNIKTK